MAQLCALAMDSTDNSCSSLTTGGIRVADWAETIDVGRYGQSNRTWLGMSIYPAVFLPIAVIAFAVILFSVIAPQASADWFSWLRATGVAKFNWFLLSVGNLALLFCVGVAVSPLGKIRLGGKGAKPEYSRMSWFSMLFGAGMGIGLVFYGVGEPVTHFAASMVGGPAAPLGGAAGDAEGARSAAMAATVYNWALHPWAIYAVVGLALAVFSYDFNMPLSLRSAFYPLIGPRVWGRSGDMIDVLAVFATLFGLASSLGLGASQAMAGITHLYGIPNSTPAIVGLIAIMALVTFLSVRGGIDKGIRILSEVNMWIALGLILFVLATGATLVLLGDIFRNLVEYAKLLPAFSNPIGRTDTGFYNDWTAYYWTWWISWAPFVGLFMARISLGRTVREFLAGVLIAPTLLCVLWLTTFGDGSIAQIVSGALPDLAKAPLDTQLFLLLESLPLAQVTSFVAICLILIFFITGWDSGTLVIDTMTSGGRTDTPLRQKIFWLFAVGGTAVVLLISGGLVSLQAAAIASGIPLALVLLFLCWGTLKGLLVLHRTARDG
jgi:betaine/carnitine transporter, BCCT family